jgi:type 1 glutamine amidotransferase
MKRSVILMGLLAAALTAQTPPPAPGGRGPAGGRGGAPPASTKKHVLVFGLTKGFHHDSTSNAMATVWKLGKESGLWDTEIATNTEILRKGEKAGSGFTPLNLLNFDAIIFANTTGELPLDEQQKKDIVAFIHDDGKGFVGIHAALDTNYKWPEYGEMLGGWFDGHPWNTFDAPIIVEDSSFTATRHFAKSFRTRDEIYMPKEWSRDKVNVLMRLDDTKLDYEGKTKIRPDHDFAVAWSKMYGKGRVFYSTLGHTNEAWDDPDVQKMYLEAIKWVLGRTDGSTAPHAKTTN